jgi:hypothetical protein
MYKQTCRQDVLCEQQNGTRHLRGLEGRLTLVVGDQAQRVYLSFYATQPTFLPCWHSKHGYFYPLDNHISSCDCSYTRHKHTLNGKNTSHPTKSNNRYDHKHLIFGRCVYYPKPEGSFLEPMGRYHSKGFGFHYFNHKMKNANA